MSGSAYNTIVVTGATGGMGLAISHSLFKTGYSLALIDTNASALDALAATLNAVAAPGQRAWGSVADVSSTPQVKELFSQAVEKLGPLYGLVHTAGILGSIQPADEHEESDWERIISVNLVGHIKVVTEAIRVFKKQGAPPKSGYSIVTIGSYNVARPQINIAVYSSTKGAVKTFNACVAKENARPEELIRVNTVNPGGIRTPMVEGIIAKRGPQVPYEVCPMSRWGTSEEIANCVEFLISPKASFVTGAAYDVDGGRNA